MKLSNKTLDSLQPSVVVPSYNRDEIQQRMIHIGFGAFHRAHQAVYADLLASKHNSTWGYGEVNLMRGGKKIDDLKAQDYLFSICEKSTDYLSVRVIGVVKNAYYTKDDGIDVVLTTLTDPNVSIVSMTVTEKGYYYTPATSSIDKENEAIKYDIQNPQAPTTMPGIIVEALRLRKEKSIKPFTVMSCDNIPENGKVIRNVVLDLAKEQSIELSEWIAKNVTFPSTMVDRIVPAVTDETLKEISDDLGEIEDSLGVACETFSQWVIEDKFVAGRPEWEKVGVELVDNVLPYEEMKLRMLNGSHSYLAYLGYLAGYKYIDECMKDQNFGDTAHYLMMKEQAPTLHVKGIDLEKYAQSLLVRYTNTSLKHRTWQIAMDGTLKLPQRMLDSIRYHLDNNTSFDCLALGVAAWMRYVSAKDDKGDDIEISDPCIDKIKELVNNSIDGLERVTSLLSLQNVFGSDLPQNKYFVDCVLTYYLSLKNKGAKVTVLELNKKLSNK